MAKKDVKLDEKEDRQSEELQESEIALAGNQIILAQ